jgi:hypothetical protein
LQHYLQLKHKFYFSLTSKRGRKILMRTLRAAAPGVR